MSYVTCPNSEQALKSDVFAAPAFLLSLLVLSPSLIMATEEEFREIIGGELDVDLSVLADVARSD